MPYVITFFYFLTTDCTDDRDANSLKDNLDNKDNLVKLEVRGNLWFKVNGSWLCLVKDFFCKNKRKKVWRYQDKTLCISKWYCLLLWAIVSTSLFFSKHLWIESNVYSIWKYIRIHILHHEFLCEYTFILSLFQPSVLTMGHFISRISVVY